MRTKPFIGITTDFRSAAKGRSPHSYVHAGYYDCILAAGGLPVIIPPVLKEADLKPYLERLDGILLTGGNDLDPRKMNIQPHPAVRPIAERRENFDRMLCRLALERQMPILGVALGMQLLNVLCGGTLYMHLPEDFARGLPHMDPLGGTHRHIVNIVPGTRMEEMYGEGEIRVNSYHHQAVRRVASRFRVGATAPDGLVEAIEFKDRDYFCVGVQWHPENETASALDMQLFEAFIAASATPVPTLVARAS